jgi:TolB protein
MLLLISLTAHAQLTIEITRGADNPIPIAISPFSWEGGGSLPEDVSAIIESDLNRTGLFNVLNKGHMLSFPDHVSKVFYRDWRALGRDYLVVGKIYPVGDMYEAKYSLLDVVNQKPMLEEYTVKVSKTGLRDMAHHISDKVFERITGIRGAFSTRMIYLSRQNIAPGKFNYQLYVADSDGARAQKVLDSREPIMSPTWSPDGKRIAYSAFDNGRPSIYVHTLATGAREKLTNFKGINSSPAWSPDGRQLAMTLSKDGSPDIYVMDLATRNLLKVAPHNFAIDTEPQWMPDGKTLVFTSNRGGQPQIYQVEVYSGYVKRLSFEGNYNARARILPDGSGIIMVHRNGGDFKIARLDLKNNRTYVLTSTQLDESPSIAANGTMVLYAAKRGGNVMLAAVSIDGRVSYNLPSQGRDVREPVWSPFLN